MAIRIVIPNRVIFTIGKQIFAEQRFLCCWNHLRLVCVDEAAGFGVVVAGLEVVEAGLAIVVITAVADGVDVADEGGGGLHRTAGIGHLCRFIFWRIRRLAGGIYAPPAAG